ncbi:cell wall protein [Streptomyces chilikensis]|uniref:Cell wall protein n=1 Tax=Streptomyces chilikensis TaxID=1194079 RepID=A0ABV3EZB4_9ACTN
MNRATEQTFGTELPLARSRQELATTPSRHAQPAAWLRAVEWLVRAGLHRKAGGRTLEVARELARRMDYTEGTVLHRLEETAERLGVSAATLKRHVRYLREPGALAWVRHGSLANLLLPGCRCTATATVYAATVPPVYDRAMGHRVEGAGYRARVVGVTTDGRGHAVNAALTRVFREPQSLTPAPVRPEPDPGAKPKDTGPRRSRKAARGPVRSPAQVERDIRIARQVRPLVGWTQHECLRRLAHALRPLIDKGLDARAIAADLTVMNRRDGRRPERPAAFISARLPAWEAHEAELAEEERARAEAADPWGNAEWQEAATALRATCAPRPEPRTDEDRRLARAYAVLDPVRVITHLREHGLDDTVDLYGAKGALRATRLADSPHLKLA